MVIFISKKLTTQLRKVSVTLIVQHPRAVAVKMSLLFLSSSVAVDLICGFHIQYKLVVMVDYPNGGKLTFCDYFSSSPENPYRLDLSIP